MTEQLGTKMEIVKLDEQNNYGKFVMMPLERRYRTILGNSLRKVLLSSLPGAVILRINVQGMAYEMPTIRGVKEDAPEITLNLKGAAVEKYNEEPILLSVGIKNPYVLITKDTLVNADLEVRNPNHYIATLNEDASLEIQIAVINGKDYKTSEFNKTGENIIGDITIDSLFSPVKKVNFTVDNARAGQVTDYDRLTIEVWTNGTIRPQDALSEGSNILINCLELFSELPNYECNTDSDDEDNQKDRETQMVINIKELNLSSRSFNCLKRANISTVGDIVSHTGADMMKIKNFGKRPLDEVGKKLQEMGLTFKQKVKDE